MTAFQLSLFVFSILLASLSPHGFAIDGDRQLYVVYMGSSPAAEAEAVDQHRSMLRQVISGSSVEESLTCSYMRSFNGFAARLTEEESQKIGSMEGVISVFPSKFNKLQTTRSWDFLGLRDTVKRVPAVESDIIIGMLDSGIWPESESFNDEGFGPPPKKWKGTCVSSSNFTCNNKVIGARFYGEDSFSPRDTVGHGTHTASIVAGNEVKDASLYGLGKGNARGGVPLARIAVYKVCTPSGCEDASVLKAFDDAVADGVDLISISIGRGHPLPYAQDVIAVGALHALQKGILTIHSAGNSGPDSASVESVQPWVFSVAASTIDRKIISRVSLGNGRVLEGNAINTFQPNAPDYPLVYMGDINKCEKDQGWCSGSCMDERLTKGKIVFCDGSYGKSVDIGGGAVGIIKREFLEDTEFSSAYPYPATAVGAEMAEDVSSYINGTKDARANIFKSEEKKDPEAPAVVNFSSRGPNSIVWDILKPDITAPGADILAAYSSVPSLTGDGNDNRHVRYNMLSGTSMSCPHVTGAAAYVKAFHPDWSPSAIKSALMTTASRMNASKHEYLELEYGAGQVNPVAALNPGLIYDAQASDYASLLCNQGHNTDSVRRIYGDDKISCTKSDTKSAKDLNYPSMAAKIDEGGLFRVNFSRTVTNVGSQNVTYSLKVFAENSSAKITLSSDVGVQITEREANLFC